VNDMSKSRQGIFIVIYSLKKNPEYLLLKRKLHWKGWEFPKGGIKLFETKKRAVKRETNEETGLDILKIKNHRLRGKYRYDRELIDRKGILGQTYTLFSVQVKKNKVKLDKRESSDYIWLNYEKALKKLTWPNQKKSLRIVNNWINNCKTKK